MPNKESSKMKNKILCQLIPIAYLTPKARWWWLPRLATSPSSPYHPSLIFTSDPARATLKSGFWLYSRGKTTLWPGTTLARSPILPSPAPLHFAVQDLQRPSPTVTGSFFLLPLVRSWFSFSGFTYVFSVSCVRKLHWNERYFWFFNSENTRARSLLWILMFYCRTIFRINHALTSSKLETKILHDTKVNITVKWN